MGGEIGGGGLGFGGRGGSDGNGGGVWGHGGGKGGGEGGGFGGVVGGEGGGGVWEALTDGQKLSLNLNRASSTVVSWNE